MRYAHLRKLGPPGNAAPRTSQKMHPSAVFVRVCVRWVRACQTFSEYSGGEGMPRLGRLVAGRHSARDKRAVYPSLSALNNKSRHFFPLRHPDVHMARACAAEQQGSHTHTRARRKKRATTSTTKLETGAAHSTLAYRTTIAENAAAEQQHRRRQRQQLLCVQHARQRRSK